MEVSLDFDDEEWAALERLAAREGVTVEALARRAIKETLASDHRRRVTDSADRVVEAHRDALDRLAE